MSTRLNRITALLLIAASALSGCVAHEAMGRPPSQAEIERIRSFSSWNGRPEVRYAVEPIPTCPPPGCWAGAGTPAAEPIDLDYHYAPPPPMPGDAGRIVVKSVRVRDRGRGALIGGVIGGAALPVLRYVLLAAMAVAFGAGEPKVTCDDYKYCSATSMLGHLILPGAALGAIPGFLIGGDRVFDFGDSP